MGASNAFSELLEKMFLTGNDKVKGSNIEKEDNEVDSSPKRENERLWSGEAVDIQARTQVSVILVKPTSFDSVVEITKLIKDRLTIVLNLEQVDIECSRRIVDFVAGVTYARNGVMRKIAKSTCLITPYEIEVPVFDYADAQFEDIKEMFGKHTSGEQKPQPILPRADAQDIHAYMRSHQKPDSFTEYMLRIIQERGLREADVYNRVFMDRKLFNKIRNNPAYQPSKRTALLLAIALRLNLAETEEFLEKAGFVLSHSNKTDLIVEYCISNKKYNIMEINDILDDFGMPPLL